MENEQPNQLPNIEQPAEEPKSTERPQTEPMPTDPVKQSKWHRFRKWYGSHKKRAIPLTVLVLVVIVALIPWSRYQTAGLVLKRDAQVKVLDSIANTPVSGAQVSLDDNIGTTDGNGLATIKNVPVGRHTAVIKKKYYKDERLSVLVPIRQQKQVPEVKVEATGRQAKIVVKDKISQKPLADVDIKTADTDAKTDKNGEAIIVLPVEATEGEVTLTLEGYNEAKVEVQASATELKQNDLTMTPTGKIYFLSKLSGRIDVVKTNLDGTDRKIVLAGTGNEDDENTVLLATEGWKYLALKSDRSGTGPALYIINTANDELSTIDSTKGDFNLIGWDEEFLVYELNRSNLNEEQAGKYSIKSYNAANGSQILLARSQAKEVTIEDDFGDFQVKIGETFQIVGLTNQTVFFTKDWIDPSYDYPEAVESQTMGVYSIGVNGSSSKKIQSWPADRYSYFSIEQYRPSVFYIYKYGDSATQYYELRNGNWTSISKSQIPKSGYNSYYGSPAGQQTFWTEKRDGKNTLFVGDQNGSNGKQIATLSDYEPYGWFTDKYLLVSKKDSELYILPVEGVKTDADAVKITDYHKPDYSYYGYGY